MKSKSRTKTKKVYTYGDVLSIRLSPDSGCDQEILDWINHDSRNRSQEIMEIIKLKIALEKKVSDKMDLLLNDSSGYVSDKSTNKQANSLETIESKKEIIIKDRIENVVNGSMNTSDDEVFIENNTRSSGGKSTIPALRAMKSIRR